MAHSKDHYIKIWGVLIVLLIISVIGPEIGVLWITLITAFGIAGVKAYLVIVHFMHLPLDKKFCTYLLVTCMAFMLLFFAFVAPDIMNHEGRNWVNTAAKHEVKCANLAHDKKIEKDACKKMTYPEVVAFSKSLKAPKGAKRPAPKAPKTPKH